MPVYEYKGFNAQGKAVQGVQEADGPRALKAVLRKEGILLTEVFEDKGSGKTKAKMGGSGAAKGGLLSKEVDFQKYFQRISAQEISLFTRQLATLTRAGIPLIECLTALAEQTDNDKFKRVLSQVKDRVNEGAPFADALREHPKVFNHLYVNMVRAGEAAGALDLVLTRLADYNEKQMELRQKVSGALTYPVIMIIFAILVVFILMTVVVPRVSKLFEDIGATLPWSTRLLIGISNFVSSWWFLIIPFFGLGFYLIRRYINTDEGRQKYDAFVLRVPIFGRLIAMVATTRFASTLATLLSSGVPMLSALDIVKTVVGNHQYSDVIEKARENVREGESLAIPLQRSGKFDPIVSHMITVGERSGELETMLGHVSNAYESQVEARISQLTSVLEPLILIVMAVIVGFVVMSIMLPILQINSAIQG